MRTRLLLLLAAVSFSLSLFQIQLQHDQTRASGQQQFAPNAGSGDAGSLTKVTDGFSVAKTNTQNCASGTCSPANSWDLGLSSSSPVNVSTTTVFSYDLSALAGDLGRITNLTFGFGGCWHGGSGRSCNGGSNPGFDNNGGVAYFEIRNGANWEQLGATNLGTYLTSSADDYDVYQVSKSSGLSASYLQSGILKVRVRTAGRTSGNLGVAQVTDFALVTVDLNDPTHVHFLAVPFGTRRTWGMSWGDFDNDGDPDLFVNAHYDRPVLYRNNGNGTFSNITTTAGMAILTDRHGCAWGDFNADTFVDLYCQSGAESRTGSKPNQLFKNNQDGTFSELATQLGVVDGPGSGRSANWFDYDGDGQIDLYLGDKLRAGFYPSLLFKGSSGTFAEVGAFAGLAESVQLRSSSWADFDNDGNPDLLIAPGTGNLILHRNNGNGTFASNSAVAAGLVSDMNFSGSWGDYNNDGYLDLFVARLPGNKSILYRNNRDGTFVDATASSGINTSLANVGQWGDYNNDGNLDLFVVNGLDTITGSNAPDSLYMSNGDGTFTEQAANAGITGPANGNGDSAAWADYNNDGNLDIFVTNGAEGAAAGPDILYTNDGNSNHWIEFKLAGSTNNTKALGAKVTIVTAGRTQLRQLTDNVAQYGQNDQIVHFGLGSSDTVGSVQIIWPNGSTTTLNNTAANQILTVTQP